MKIWKKVHAVLLAAAMLTSFWVMPVSAQTENVQLLANGGFELADDYGFPLNWSSNGENLIPNGDFESRYYWMYNNGYLSYEHDDELDSTVGKLAWNGSKTWNAITMRTDKYGLYWDYAQNKRIDEPTKEYFGGVPVAWGERYIPRMKMKYTGDLVDSAYLEMEMKIGSALFTVSEGNTYDIINVAANTFPRDTWKELGGEGYAFTVPSADSIAAGYTDQTPGIIKLINVGRGLAKTDADFSTVFTWTDDARFEKIGRTGADAVNSGAKSLMVRGYADGVTEEWKSDFVSVDAGETLEVKSMVRVDEIASYIRDTVTVSPEVSVSVEFNDGTSAKVGGITDVTDGFVQIAGSVPVPAGVYSARLVYTFDGKGTAYFDDAQINAQRAVQDVDTGAYFNRLANGGFEVSDSSEFPVSWDSNGKNLIPNGDFEANSLAAGSNLTNTKALSYAKVGGVDNVQIAENENAPSEFGKYSLKMTWNKIYWGGAVVQDDTNGVLRLAYDADYILRAAVRAGANEHFANQRFQFNIIPSYTRKDSIVDDNSWTPTTEWQEFAGTFSTPEKSAEAEDGFPFAARYQVRARSSSTADAELYVDNFSMEKLGRTDSADSMSGKRSLKIVAYDDGIDEVWKSERVSVRENQELAVGAAYRTQALDGGVSIAANFYQGDKAVGSIALVEGAVSDAWRNVAKAAVVPAGADSAEIVITVPGKGGCAWIDDVFLGEKAGNPIISSVDYSVDDLYGHGGETVRINVHISNFNKACKAFVGSALYDDEDNLAALDLSMEDIADNIASQSVIRNITLPEDKDLTDYKIKTFLWQSLETMTPFCGAEVFPGISGSFTVNKVFQDNMVLQRDREIAVYGQGKPGEPIAVRLGEDRVTVQPDAEGDWIAYLPARSASTDGISLTVWGRGGRKFNFENILIGDVFIMSGQSNAAFSLSEVNAFRAQPDAPNDNIRVLGMYEASNNDALGSAVEKKDLPTAAELNVLGKGGVTDPTWLTFAPRQTDSEIKNDPLTRDTSAILYYFAKNVQREIEASTGEAVPMGLITAAVGGTRIEKWLPKEVYAQNTGLTADQEALRSTLYNNMINPLTKFRVKGILWYQGCANVANTVRYEKEMRLLIESWRTRFGDQDLPFIIHQLAGFGDQYGLLRDAQKSVAEKMDNVELNVLIDLGEKNNIHPQAKEAAGKRAAGIALKQWYGFESTDGVFADFDRYELTEHNGNPAMKLHFKNVTDGFYTVNESGERMEKPQPDGFLIADSNGEFKRAQAVLNEDNTITIWNEHIVNPVYVRYAFEGFPYPGFANLYTENGLPLTPFRNDKINVEYSLDRAELDSSVNMVLDGDFETVAADGTTFSGYYTHRVTNTSYGGVKAAKWDTKTDKYGQYYVDMTLINGTGNANSQVYTAITGAKENLRIPVREGTYIIEADVETGFTDASTQLYMQWALYKNDETLVGNFYTNNGDWMVTESTDGMVHVKGTVTFDSQYNDCYICAFGPRLTTKSTDVQNAKLDNLVFRRASEN